ncbi:MAG: DUF72 domain-containing protein [Candidatus Hydrogenedentes bacterium]|nr:DUF72 domain-containing protein [Candidatus Hydrogenedentota bacterium]
MVVARAENLRVGVAGWSYEDWKGVVYPTRMPRSLHPLTFLCQYLDVVEINSSFYSPPNPRFCESWVVKVATNPRFLFTAKLWQRFTHERDVWPGREETRLVKEGLAPLLASGKLGAVLVQFPWSFKNVPENQDWLARVLDTFQECPLSLEIRHASWNVPEVYEELAARQVAFCNIDQPLFSHSIKPSARVTAPVGYIRLHGRNHNDWFRESAGRDDRYNYLYSEEELKPWIDKIQRMKKVVNDLFIITNNHYRGQAVVNALEIQAAIGRTFAELPPQLVTAYPRLGKLTENAPGEQAQLF